MSDRIILKKCDENDVSSLSKIGVSTFEETFAAVNSKENMEAYLQKDFNEEKILREVQNPDSIFMLAQINENGIFSTAGYMKVNFAKAQTEEGYDNSMEIQRIYVKKSYKGKGVGSKLMETALDLAKDKCLDYVWLGVWENNFKALRFYQDKGFVIFGKHTFVLGEDRQTDLLMKKMLD
ncbi:MAG: GNAT family N-acetyltransferase [Treponema sp.]|nr:GNAT family N-acetyltransferase [Treponema sp.]